MRDAFHEELDATTAQVVRMANMAESAIMRATSALLEADLTLAEVIIKDNEHLHALREDLDIRLLHIVARQQPVATDLRLVLTSLKMTGDLERMGDLAQHIAKVARRRYPSIAIPVELRDTFTSMGATATRLVTKAAAVIADHDVTRALEVERDDDEMDRAHKQVLQALLSGKLPLIMEEAVDVTLCGRYYERFADHAVTVAKQVVFIVTGEDADYYIPEASED